MRKNYIKLKNLPDMSIKNFNKLGGCFDHCKMVKGVYVSQPYTTSMESIKQLITYCEYHGLTFNLDGESNHHPHCFKIEIYKPIDERQVDTVMRQKK